jgi:hypothetical protein
MDIYQSSPSYTPGKRHALFLLALALLVQHFHFWDSFCRDAEVWFGPVQHHFLLNLEPEPNTEGGT